MKKALILAAVLLLLAPVSAMAGMTAFMNMDEMAGNEMADVTGQTGITIDSTVNITDGWVAWGDGDGDGGGTNTTGYFIISSIHTANPISAIVELDACTNAAGTTSYLLVTVSGITLDTTVDLLLGATSSPAAATDDLGELTIGSLKLAATTIKIYGH